MHQKTEICISSQYRTHELAVEGEKNKKMYVEEEQSIKRLAMIYILKVTQWRYSEMLATKQRSNVKQPSANPRISTVKQSALFA